MKVLWAPWRMAYIKNARKPAACIFCVKPRERRDAANLLLHRGRHGLVMMNLFPYNSGHLLIAPYLHVRSLEQLPDEVSLDLMKLIQLSLRVLRAEMKPEGFNIGLNLGRVAGAGIERHVHFHIVPRWNGDTNFMPLFGEVRVMPEYLETTYRKLKTRFEAPAGPGKKRTRR
jgi:ATP adenylyltransferase